MNLDNDDEEDEEHEVMQDAKRTEMEQLEKVLSRCQKCGSEKACKIDTAENHVPLTMQQRQSWSVALVSIPTLQYASKCLQSTKPFDRLPKAMVFR